MIRDLLRRPRVHRPADPVPAGSDTPRIAVLGAGAGGLCAGMRLRQAGIESFTIYEKADGVGGTWRDNTYPGACCDVMSHLYSFSFAPNPDWSRQFAEQPEILEYFERCADEHGLRPHLRFGTEIAAADWDEDDAVWRLRTAAGEELEADVVISGLGQLNRPFVPDIPGLAEFRGTAFHSARWRHDHDLTGARVAVVGSAASAVQFIPRIAERVDRLYVFQRSANWIIPKPNRRYAARTRSRLRRSVAAMAAQRAAIYWSFEVRYLAFRRPSRTAALMERLARTYLATQVTDPGLRAALTPDHPIGCKRILAASDYYPALLGDHVELVTVPIERIAPGGVRTSDGDLRGVDTLIFATGFDTTHFLSPLTIRGRDGRVLDEVWAEGAEAHLGITVAGFPNLFLLYGPNTNLGHNSILFMLECQVDHLVKIIRELVVRGASSCEIRPQPMAAYNRWVQDTMRDTVWETGCTSWYKTAAGKVTNNWPATTVRYWRDTRRPRFDDYRWEPARRQGHRTPAPLRAPVSGSVT